MKKCTKCEGEGPFHKDKYRRDGLQSWCATCSYEHCIAYRKTSKGKESRRKTIRQPNSRYAHLKNLAKRTNRKCTLTFKQWWNKVKENKCYYCEGSLPETSGSLDRVNSNLDYTTKNTVPSCLNCQNAKNDLPEKEFFFHVKSLSKSKWFKEWSKKQ